MVKKSTFGDSMMAAAMKVLAMKISPTRLPRPLATLAFSVVLGMAAPATLWAQGLSTPGAEMMPRPGAGVRAHEAPKVPAPDAIPGAKPRAPAAPAGQSAMDMQPNEALFDAINRGDIAAARDALSRGADLNARNVLGMTPMDLSVDLGRNDISFLLLSMRGEDGGGNPTNASNQAPTFFNQPVKSSSKTARKTPVAVIKPVMPPKLFAKDGGTPMPSAGFLGFGPRSADN